MPGIIKLPLCPKKAQDLGSTPRLGQIKSETPLSLTEIRRWGKPRAYKDCGGAVGLQGGSLQQVLTAAIQWGLGADASLH